MPHADNAPAPIPAQFADPTEMVGGRVKKRVIVCCDGWVLKNIIHTFNDSAGRTWQDGIDVKERWKYTNILVKAFLGCRSII